MEKMMRILVFGAGPLGSLLAARLSQGGQQVTLLARGQRLDDLRKNGIRLKSWANGTEEVVRVELIESLRTDDRYGLVIVVMRKNSALKILPTLASNASTLFLFLMNNAAGPAELENAIGTDRVLTGFMGAAGYREADAIVYLNAEPDRPGVIYLGEPNGGVTPRLQALAEELGKGKYIQVKTVEKMDAWLKYHVAFLFPAFVPALYLCGNDHLRFARTRDALILAWRGLREALSVLKRLGIPPHPPILNAYYYLPEPLAVWLLARLLRNPRMEVAVVRHAEVIRDEIQQLNQEFLRLAERSGFFTPTILFLTSQFNQRVAPLPDGSRSLRMDWSGVLIPLMLLVLAALALLLIL
jgi:ketopantoate reductase